MEIFGQIVVIALGQEIDICCWFYKRKLYLWGYLLELEVLLELWLFFLHESEFYVFGDLLALLRKFNIHIQLLLFLAVLYAKCIGDKEGLGLSFFGLVVLEKYFYILSLE